VGAWALCGIWAACDPEVIVGHETVGQLASAGSSGQQEPPIPWSAGHETGNLDEWTADGFGWLNATREGGKLEVVSEQAHTGSGSLKSSLTATGAMEQAVAGRYATLAEGYYSAWYFIPSLPEPSGRVIMKLSGGDPYRSGGDPYLDAYWLANPEGFTDATIDSGQRIDYVFSGSGDGLVPLTGQRYFVIGDPFLGGRVSDHNGTIVRLRLPP